MSKTSRSNPRRFSEAIPRSQHAPRHRIRPNALAEEKKLRDELEQQPISFDLALALRHHIETVRRDAENGNGKIDEDMERAKRRAEINDLLLDILEKITTPISKG